MRKAKWYLKNNLAKIICEDPLKLQLTFQNKGCGNKNDPYLISQKETICVVCGSVEDLTRHHVVPYCYRKFLPMELKDKDHYDVLLVCSDCHFGYEKKAFKFKQDLKVKYGIPRNGILKYPSYILSLVNTLTKHWDKIPEDKRNKMLREVRDCLGENLEKDDLFSLSISHKDNTIKSGEQMLVEKIEDYQEFIILWRKHFVDTMNPKFLHDFWTVDRERAEKYVVSGEKK